ncbi:MAG: FAD-dependent oxidoreductase [Alphaproteobacteria bacterium]|nr:FAD-dependent oxidoreductase [Alphaproteobacteria bacterium]
MSDIIYKRFYNYLEMPKIMPRFIIYILRLVALSATGGLILALSSFPDLGHLLLWGIIVPLLPLLIMVVPGFWRNICPAATLNQIAPRFNLGLKLKLSPQLRSWCYAVAAALLFILILLNLVSGPVQFGYSLQIMVAFLGIAFIMGFIFEGKAGWCGTFCPFSPLERVLGSTPMINNRNSFCKTCVGCQKNCMDFSPRAAFISDFYDTQTSYRNLRVLFMAFVPGFFAGLFFPPFLPNVFGTSTLSNIVAYSMLTVGVFHLLRAYAPVSAYRIAHSYVLLSFGSFYYAMLPQIMANIRVLEQAMNNQYVTQVIFIFSDDYINIYYAGLLILMAMSFLISITHEIRFTITGTLPDRFRVNTEKLLRSIKEFNEGMVVKEETNDISFSIFEGQTLLNALETADFHIESGCRMGVCGSDPVAITDNAENLSPITPEEMDTLSRLGLLGHARLACMTTVSGSVGISVDCFSHRAKNLNGSPKSNVGWGMLNIPEYDKNKEDPLQDKKVVVLGNGVAGMSTVQYLRKLSKAVDITVMSNEIFPFYNRMGICKLLENKLYSNESMILLPPDWYDQNNVKQKLNTKASRINIEDKTVHFGQQGDGIEFDILVLALGAKARVSDIQGFSLEGCFAPRSMEDIAEINNYIQQARVKKITVIGGGWQGIEMATMLKKRNYEVTLIHAYENLLNKLNNPKASQIIESFLTNQARVEVLCQSGVSRISGQSKVEKVHLTQDKTIDTDLCIFATGAEANMDFVNKSNIECGTNGIRVNRKMQTSEPDIYAVGDCAQILDEPIGIWGTSMEMGKIAALNIAGKSTDFNTDMCLLPRILKIPQLDFRCFGQTSAGVGDKMFEAHDIANNKYWSVVVNEQDYMVGGVFVNHYEMANSLYKAMRYRLDVSKLLPTNPSEQELATDTAQPTAPSIPSKV